MNFDTIKQVYFIGIGGIGMSALARFFTYLGKPVAGYDRTPTTLTHQLEQEGMHIHYEDNLHCIPHTFLDAFLKDETLIIYTPAVPQSHTELTYFRSAAYTLRKRAQVLGMISTAYATIAVAGSHGKSTVSAMVAQLFHETPIGCSAFLGAISKNLDSNLVVSNTSQWAVMEADEFDRSFLHLSPSLALVTSMDPDHLDVYGAEDQLKISFNEFLGKVKHHATVIIKQGLDLHPPEENQLTVLHYGLNSNADYYADHILPDGLGYCFDLHTPEMVIQGLKTQVPGWINVENAVAAAALCIEAGLSPDQIASGLESFQGVKRRLDVRFDSGSKVYIDDYAHHPKEIKALGESIRKLFPEQTICAVFQPHLFSRTRDFAAEFAEELSRFDQVIMMEIYPAREEPISGVNAQLIYDKISSDKKGIVDADGVVELIKTMDWDVLLTIGAGDIDRLVPAIEKELNEVVR